MKNKRPLRGVVIALLVTAAVATVGFGPQEEQLLADIASDFYANTPIADSLSDIPQLLPLAAPETSVPAIRDVEDSAIVEAVDPDLAVLSGLSEALAPSIRDVEARSSVTIDLADDLDGVLAGLFTALTPSTSDFEATSDVEAPSSATPNDSDTASASFFEDLVGLPDPERVLRANR